MSSLCLESPVVENNLQPAGATADELSRVALAPAFHKADLHGKSGPWLLRELVVVGSLQGVCLLVVKSLDGKPWEHFVNLQRPGVGVVQCGRLDEDGITAAVVHPHAVHFLGELDAVADLAADLLHQLAFVV